MKKVIYINFVKFHDDDWSPTWKAKYLGSIHKSEAVELRKMMMEELSNSSYWGKNPSKRIKTVKIVI